MSIQDFDFSVDLLRSLLWRHNDAENLQTIIANKQGAIDTINEEFWRDWYKDVFNLKTANKFGLTVWSIILNIPLTVQSSAESGTNNSFGFGQFRKNFNNGNFSSSSSAIVLSVENARTVLRLRYYQLVTRATVTECNRIVGDVFGDQGTVYALDGLDMTMSYVFLYQPNASLRFVLQNYDILPRPSGVKLRLIYSPNQSFGFGSFRKNFNNGNFAG